MTTRTAVAGIAALLAAAVVVVAPVPAHARPAGSSTVVACTTQQLPTAKGHPVHIAVSLGGSTATLRGTSGAAYLGTPRVLRPRLTVTSAGHTAATFHPQPVAQTPGRGILVDGVDAPHVDQQRSAAPAMCMARFPSGPVALLGVTNAFNQCCFLVDTYAPDVRPRSSLQDGLVVPRLRVIGGSPVIVVADGSFLARFADYADSAAPLRVLTVRTGRQRDVTTDYPAKLRREAAKLWTRFNNRPARGLGFLAAWAADEDRLGHDSTIWPKLQELDDAGKLNGRPGWPRGQSFINALRTFLGDQGYRG